MTMIHVGDCLEVMRSMDDNSVDAVVTDPPYGLAFMGKRWDYDVPTVEVWAECLRVLKPGGHLLAFAGTRTQHRMAVRIEDAGFEIRDMIAWVYSSGFPKSHNFGCKCRGVPIPYTHGEAQREQAFQRAVCVVQDADVQASLDTCKGGGEVLQQGVPEQGTPDAGWKELATAEVRTGQPRVEGWCDVLPQTRKLQADQVCAMPHGVPVDGEERRVHHGAQADNGTDARTMLDTDGGCASQESQPAGQQARKPRVVSRQRNAQANGVGSCKVCGGLSRWAGWGTALKPAMEPITVARKPLVGTVAANVVEFGTGAINVDGCRVPTDWSDRSDSWKQSGNRAETYDGSGKVFPDSIGGTGIVCNPAGRWPANLIHDGSAEVVEGFPESGVSSGGGMKRDGKNNNVYGAHCGHPLVADVGFGDSGPAARFFYCAKASGKDRGDDNKHPTVKPTDLMRYLCRLVTPPGGVVLDPFMGSGSTGKAATLEGFQFVGIEREAEYATIARARIEAAGGLFV